MRCLFFLNILAATAAASKLFQSCPILCDPTDSRPPGSPVPGILQARILEWVAISFFAVSFFNPSFFLLHRLFFFSVFQFSEEFLYTYRMISVLSLINADSIFPLVLISLFSLITKLNKN